MYAHIKYIHIHKHFTKLMCIYIYIWLYMYDYICMIMYVCMYACMHVCMYVCDKSINPLQIHEHPLINPQLATQISMFSWSFPGVFTLCPPFFSGKTAVFSGKVATSPPKKAAAQEDDEPRLWDRPQAGAAAAQHAAGEELLQNQRRAEGEQREAEDLGTTIEAGFVGLIRNQWFA